MRKILIFIVCIILAISFNSVAFAAYDKEISTPTPAEVSEKSFGSSGLLSAADYGITPFSVTTIKAWSNSISKVNSGSVTCKAYTTASGLADKLQVKYTLYQYKNGAWHSYKNITHTKTRTSLMNDAASFSVASGYSYYVTTTHRAFTGAACTSSKTASSTSISVS
ncbi:hypothetical protein [Christensenella intestinihominis]|uniref:hypothetical protein n=1 Tax=Christensenella intestinihominis TaxID=1851429 RepID=UPI0011C7B277|nr:hypothetical protein [Christensenella intestinihominis]